MAKRLHQRLGLVGVIDTLGVFGKIRPTLQQFVTIVTRDHGSFVRTILENFQQVIRFVRQFLTTTTMATRWWWYGFDVVAIVELVPGGAKASFPSRKIGENIP